MRNKLFGVVAGVVLALACVTATTADATTTQYSWCTDHSDVALVGTSADTGYGTTGYPSGADTFQPTVYGWATRFANSAHGQWGTNTHNYAHNGALAADYLPGGRWAGTVGATSDMGSYKPDLVLVDLGGNEFLTQADPAQFQANLTQVITNIKTARPDVLIILSIYAKPHFNGTPGHPWEQYGSAIYNTAVAQQTALIDMRQYIPDADANPMTNPTVWLSDGVHLNDAGNLAEYGGWWGWASTIASTC